jgi:hypothetical protein
MLPGIDSDNDVVRLAIMGVFAADELPQTTAVQLVTVKTCQSYCANLPITAPMVLSESDEGLAPSLPWPLS